MFSNKESFARTALLFQIFSKQFLMWIFYLPDDNFRQQNKVALATVYTLALSINLKACISVFYYKFLKCLIKFVLKNQLLETF